MKRRDFLQKTGAAAAAAVAASAAPSLTSNRTAVPPSDQVRVGVIGCNGMGFSNLRSFLKIPDVTCAALCDVDRNVLEKRAAEVDELTGGKPALYGDYRRLLDDRNIDAVIVGTPDHWHCLIMVDSCAAGKDVYVEKPLANSIEECYIMAEAGRRYDRVVQVGQWQRSGQHWADALEFVQSGKIGRIRLVKAWAYQGWMEPVPVLPDEPVPEGVDYDMWLGPAPKRPFNRNRFHFSFRWFWDYAGGLMTDWGVHMIDMVLAGMNASTPKSVIASGGKFAYPDDASETPDTMQAVYEFDGFSMLWEHATGIGLGPYKRDHGVAFVGNVGTVVADRGGWEVLPEVERENWRAQSYKMDPIPPRSRVGGGGLDEHTQNFIDCMKSRQKPTCSVEIGAHTAVVAHMGNVAFKTGRKVYWDESTRTFSESDEANALIHAHYRDPWKLPNIQ